LNFYDSAIEYISERLNSTIPVLVQEAELNALGGSYSGGTQKKSFTISGKVSNVSF